MRQYLGISALSGFKTHKLLESLKEVQPDISKLSAEYIHFVDTGGKDLDSASEEILKELLNYGSPYDGTRGGGQLVVIPRPGTISPWSSKATNIATSSGLKSVRRIERGLVYYIESDAKLDLSKIGSLVHDRMTESIILNADEAEVLFEAHNPKASITINLQKDGRNALEKANLSLGLALNDEEIDYLLEEYVKIGRNPTDAELVMFGQINSEHCRHKIFNADWTIDGQKQPKSLFQMIKNTYQKNKEGVISAYTDNAAVLDGPQVEKFYPDHNTGEYKKQKAKANLVIKAETHNHPTAIAPSPGAATGVGGEIRDEAATGRGAGSKAGFTGYSVSNLEIPGFNQPWEKPYGKPERISSALDIMLKAPIGGASFANEFGRPNLAGYFRTFQQEYKNEVWGYHKPLMIAGGLGNISQDNVEKLRLKAGDLLIVLGGPSMLIGLGGGASSSLQSGQSDEELDFASVQRGSAEMQRRAQEVISRCASAKNNPIKSIHDVGAGGLSNAIPEIVHDNNLGASINLRDIPNAEPGLSPMEIWCNESQERFVLSIDKSDLPAFKKLCEKERCPFAVVGEATANQQLTVRDDYFKNNPIDIPMSTLFGSPPKITKSTISNTSTPSGPENTENIDLNDALNRILHMPAVGSKKFLITIGDRTVGGMSVRDPLVGPWQVPVSDAAVTSNSFWSESGEAMAIGERAPIALLDAPASGRMAVGEAITNIVSAGISKISDIKLSANWMAASSHGNQDKKLFDTVQAIGEDLCPKLGLTIPVGKDSLSMKTAWNENGQEKTVASPVSLVISAFAPVKDVTKTLTPMVHKDMETSLIFIDLADGKTRLGGSAISQAYSNIGTKCPDLENPELLKDFFAVMKSLQDKKLLLAYHDRSDGGLVTTLLEMAFAGRAGLDIDISSLDASVQDTLFNEELGAVIEVKRNKSEAVSEILKEAGQSFHEIGHPNKSQQIAIKKDNEVIYKSTREQLEQWWSETSYRIQGMRDNKKSADEEFGLINDNKDRGISPEVLFDVKDIKTYTDKPKIAILREQGVNGQSEMAAAFWKAGFNPVDVHMTDLIDGKISINDFKGLAACGGFSYGDVLGGGGGWAKSILFNNGLKKDFAKFFARKDTFSLGVCNGCQMLSQLKDMIPGAELWPRFLKNESEQFEARLVSVKINKSPSIFFKDMEGSVLPIPTAHGEGRAVFAASSSSDKVLSKKIVPMQYVDNSGQATNTYPYNPNGSKDGVTALTSYDGRSTIIMPHPERAFLTRQLSWHPEGWDMESPWIKMFRNARDWIN